MGNADLLNHPAITRGGLNCVLKEFFNKGMFGVKYIPELCNVFNVDSTNKEVFVSNQ